MTSGWIDIKDRLPKHNEDSKVIDRYLVAVHDVMQESIEVKIAEWHGGLVKDNGGFFVDEDQELIECAYIIITHWMPMPEFPIIIKG